MSLGIPYMGSKRKLAKKIVDFILKNNPNTKYFYDLFGGGGAISFEAATRGINVIYNEFNQSIYNFIKYLLQDTNKEWMYAWVSREDLFYNLTRTDYYSGFLKTCWSFGNNQKNYLYGLDIEDYIRSIHNYIVYNIDDNYWYSFLRDKGYDIGVKITFEGQIIKERIALFKKWLKSKGVNNERLYRLIHLERVFNVEEIMDFPYKHNISISNLSYEQVSLANGGIVYCDIPYIGSQGYSNSLFNGDDFYKWYKCNSHKVYVSSYRFYDENPVISFDFTRNFNKECRGSAIKENIYCNKEVNV